MSVLLIANSNVTMPTKEARAIFQYAMARARKSFAQSHPRNASRRAMHKRQFMSAHQHARTCE